MEKKKINNEIILLRPLAEQAKVQIISKLAKEIKKYRMSTAPGDEKAKKQKKADALAARILAIKKVEKDYIAKYILTNTVDWKKILQDPNSEPKIRMVAQIAGHKKFSKAIEEFKTKYPNYMEHLGPNHRERAKLEWKEKKKLKKNNNDPDDPSQVDENSKEDNQKVGIKQELTDGTIEDSEEEKIESDEEESDEQVSSRESESEEEVEEEKYDPVENGDEEINKPLEVEDVIAKSQNIKKEKNASVNKKKSVQISKTESLKTIPKVAKDTTVPKVKNSPIIPQVKKNLIDTTKVISKQAIVKKLSDLAKEEESDLSERQEVKAEFEDSKIKIEKEVDSFFTTGDGFSDYMSVAVPKIIQGNGEDDYENGAFNKKRFSHQQNDRFFDKVDNFKRPRWEDQQRHDDSHDRRDFQGKSARWEGRPVRSDRPQDRRGDFKDKPRWGDQARNDRPQDRRGDFKDKPRWEDRPKHGKSFEKRDSRSFDKKKTGFTNESSEVLHPSWQAKKKEQELLKTGFMGKKIVFDDN